MPSIIIKMEHLTYSISQGYILATCAFLPVLTCNLMTTQHAFLKLQCVRLDGKYLSLCALA